MIASLKKRNSMKIRTGRLLARLLRHEPEMIGLSLDAAGWADLDALLRLARRAGHPLTRDMVLEEVATNDKRRFALSEDGRRIRASQGHSIEVDLGLAPKAPPARLWHGTARASLDAIFAEGLRPMKRRQVHLSTDQDTALRVGSRHGRAVVLAIDAAAMAAAGHVFVQAENGVWMTDAVPPEFLGFDGIELPLSGETP
jgi:putative RNA 2'-phosphotransferase